MIKATDFKNGTIFDNSGSIFEVIWFQHHKPGKGGAMVRTKIKNLLTGSTVDKTFKPDEKFRLVDTERRRKTFMYSEGETAHFMDMKTYDQVEVPMEKLGESSKFLAENMEVEALYLDGKLLAVEVPASVVLKVDTTVPGVKGDSVSNLTKPATLENGYELTVPLFIKEGDKIRVDTRDGHYIERMKV